VRFRTRNAARARGTPLTPTPTPPRRLPHPHLINSAPLSPPPNPPPPPPQPPPPPFFFFFSLHSFLQEEDFCHEFHLVDLRVFDNCASVLGGVDEVFNLAADMGGMGFIQSNHSVIMYNNTMISFNMLEAARLAGVSRFFYASSACIYPEFRQLDVTVEGGGLKESDAWPAQPQDAYGLEKLATEELAMHYDKDFGMACRVARFHNIYGPHGTWKGGREKAPAAFCRKALCAEGEVEMWGDGKQTRSFTFIDDCVEGILRLMASDFREPLNLGSSEMVSMNEMMALALGMAGKADMPIRHIPGPEGVRGRNSDNALILEKLGWQPTIKLAAGLACTFGWIKGELAEEGGDAAGYAKSAVCGTQAPVALGALRQADGAEDLSATKKTGKGAAGAAGPVTPDKPVTVVA